MPKVSLLLLQPTSSPALAPFPNPFTGGRWKATLHYYHDENWQGSNQQSCSSANMTAHLPKHNPVV